jgi:dTDP-4-dehydrorhamnose 3,5-epimerase
VDVTALAVSGARRLDSPVHGDERGFFREWFKLPDLAAAGLGFTCQQANLSRSAQHVVRGLHYSLAPEGQAKVVTCADGELDEVLVDVRVGSPTFGRVEVVTLRAGDGASVYVPTGVAHGFVVRSATATLCYLLSSPYRPELELTIHPQDTELGVPWGVSGEPILSPRDAEAPSLALRRANGELPQFPG